MSITSFLLGIFITTTTGLPNCYDSSDGFFSYPFDCQYYYECINGTPELRYCLPGYNWNIEIDACDPEANVDCSHIATPGPPTTPRDNTEVTCPNTPGTIYLSHPYDCAYFYECFEGNKTLLRCAVGYFWNKEKHMCDIASQVDCSCTSVRPQSTDEENRCVGKPEGSFLPDLDHCTKYIRCDHGVEVAENCSIGTIWDESLVTCVDGSC